MYEKLHVWALYVQLLFQTEGKVTEEEKEKLIFNAPALNSHPGTMHKRRLVSSMEAAPTVSCPGQYVLGQCPTENSLGQLERAHSFSAVNSRLSFTAKEALITFN